MNSSKQSQFYQISFSRETYEKNKKETFGIAEEHFVTMVYA